MVAGKFPLRNVALVAGLLAAATLTGGCTSMLVGAGATAGVTVAQERSVGRAIDDTTIHLDIGRRMFEVDERLFTKVNIEVVEGRVLLTGTVPKPEDRVEAARLAWAAPGVREVINEVQVTDKSSLIDFAKDAWITTQLRAALLRDTGIVDINYTVETVNGVIYLMGIAQGQDELDKVTNYARNIAGVKKVKSHVWLKDDRRRRGT